MGKTNLYRVTGTPYQLEELPTGSDRYVIWDTRLEAAMDAWENLDEEEWENTPMPPSPIVHVVQSLDEAREWVKQATRVVDDDYAVTFLSLLRRV